MINRHPNGIIHVPRRFVAEEWGGTETAILEIARRQQRVGARPEICTSMALASRHAENIGGVPVRRFGHTYPFFGLSVADRAALDKKGGNLLSLSLFKSLLTTPNVRVSHAHALKRLGGTVRTAARLRRKPFVVSLHGGVFDVPEAERGEMLKPIANKTEWGTTPISPPSSLRRGYDRQAGPSQWLFHGPPAESKLLATTCQPRVKPTGSSILATNSPAKSARES